MEEMICPVGDNKGCEKVDPDYCCAHVEIELDFIEIDDHFCYSKELLE